MVRPDCNLRLRWDEVSLDPQTLTGWYKLDQHKNVNKGIKAEGPLAEDLVEYLLSIRPANPGNAPIHFNPETGRPFVDIRKQWERLMTIASRMLGYDLEGKSGCSSTTATPARLTSRSAARLRLPCSPPCR